MKRRLFLRGRNAHQPDDRQFKVAALRHEGVQISGQDPGFLRLFPGVHLNEQIGALAGLVHQSGQRCGQLGTVEAVDDIEQPQGLTGLICL